MPGQTSGVDGTTNVNACTELVLGQLSGVNCTTEEPSGTSKCVQNGKSVYCSFNRN